MNAIERAYQAARRTDGNPTARNARNARQRAHEARALATYQTDAAVAAALIQAAESAERSAAWADGHRALSTRPTE